jgi:hypothetical protein
MATTTNYGWAEPDNTSLVKNGAQDIRILGDAIDASVWNIGFGQAGKNKIINGDFRINQRSFTSNTADSTYNFDRFFQANSGGTFTSTPQTFTPGAAPVSGYEGSTFLQVITAGSSGASDFGIIRQRIESVRSFANQTVTVSFWAKAGTGTPKIATEISQNFGSGGSPSAAVNTTGAAVTLSTSWARYSTTIIIPSISGKTLGTTNDGYLELNLWLNAGSTFNTRASSIGNQNATFQIWGVQLEVGSTATPFQTASGGSRQAELAMCQRYYLRFGGLSAYQNFGVGFADQTTTAIIQVPLPATMRVAPASIDFSTLNLTTGGTNTAVTSITFLSSMNGNGIAVVYPVVASGLTVNRPYFLTANNSTSGYLGLSAEL